MEKLIHISQPRIYPHVSYFSKIHRADFFVVSNDLENQKGKFELRNKYYCKLSNQPKYLNIPIVKKDIFEYIELRDPKYHVHHRKIIKDNYKHYPYFNEEILNIFIPSDKCMICYDMFINRYQVFLEGALNLLQIDTPWGSALEVNTKLKKTERLDRIVEYFNGDSYLSGIAGKDYIKSMKVPYIIHEPQKDQYSYREGDNNYYMILDTIFTVGLERTIQMIKKG